MTVPKKILVAAVAAATVALGSTSAMAWRGDGDRSERMIERVAERLELDDNQRAALDTLATEMRETRELMRGGDGELRGQIEGLIGADTLDQGAALALIQTRTAALDAQAPELVAAAATFLDGLDAEQKGDIEEFLEKRGGRDGHRR